MASRRPRPVPALGLLALFGACDDTLESSAPEPAAVIERALAPAPVVELAVAPAITITPPSPAASAELAAWLRDAAVDERSFARRAFFSWTTTTAAARIRRERELFDDAQLPSGPTPYVQRLEYLASRDDTSGQLAKLLLGHPDLARRRYAWVRPWATRMGLVADYGEQLIAVTLRADAIVGRFDPALDEPWLFHDLDGREVPLGRVLADPSRVGAILHVRSDGEPHFREYVLCNASAIESWSLATIAIATAIDEDVAAVRELATLAEHDDVAGYDATLAFEVEHYRATPANLVAIAAALEGAAQAGKPLAVSPRRRFRRDAAQGIVRVREVPPRFVQIA